MFKKLNGLKWAFETPEAELRGVEDALARKRDLLKRTVYPPERKRLERGIEGLTKDRDRLKRAKPKAALYDAKTEFSLVIRKDKFDGLRRTQKKEPVPLKTYRNNKRVWWFNDTFYEADDDLSATDVKALALEQDNQKRLQLEKAHALMAMRDRLDAKAKRQPIPQEVKVAVWQRDQGRCVDCGSQAELEYDHVIPLAMGGSNTERNLQLLCAPCNRRKGATLG